MRASSYEEDDDDDDDDDDEESELAESLSVGSDMSS